MQEPSGRSGDSPVVFPFPGIADESEETHHFPLSYSQRALWFLDHLEPGNVAFNIPFALRLTGELDTPSLQSALTEVVRRHEVLRTNFAAIDGSAIQIVRHPFTLPIPVTDLSQFSDRERDQQMSSLANDEAQRSFDLERDSLVRTSLFRMAERQHVLLLTLHHIVFDGWSRAIFVRELAQLYEAFRAGLPSPLPEPALQYSDYAIWQNDRLESESVKHQVSYWKQQLAGMPQSLELPSDRSRPSTSSGEGGSIIVEYPEILMHKLRECAKQEGATLFMMLLAGFQALIFRYTAEPDFAVGVPVASRNRVELENLIGFFVNTLVLRSNLSGNPTVRELLHRVKEVALEAYAHQDVPLEKLVEELQPHRTLSHRPLFQVLFSLRNVPTERFQLAGMQIEMVANERHSAQTDMALFLTESQGRLFARWEYSTDLFDPATIQRMAGHYETLLSSAVQDMDCRMSNVPLLRAAETQQLLAWAQEGPARDWGPSDLLAFFDKQVAEHPKATAFFCGDKSITFGELQDRSDQIGRLLSSLRAALPATVGVCLERSFEQVAAMLGVWKAGHVYLPLEPSYPRERLRYMLQDSGAQIVLTSKSGEHLIADCAVRIVNLDDALHETSEPESDGFPIQPSPLDPAYLIYTSGTTGVPKGVVASHRQIINRLQWMWEAYPFAPGEVGCQKTALSFVDSLWEVLGPLLRGFPAVIISEEVLKDPARLLTELATRCVSRLWLVPTFLSSLLDAFPDDLGKRLPDLKFCVSSGEPLSALLLRRFQRVMPHAVLFNLYGTSEVWDATWYVPASCTPLRERVPIGRPISNVRVYVLDQQRQLVPIGVPGELYVAGDGLSEGYLHHLDWTAEKFVTLDLLPGRPLANRTGDRVRFLPDGNLEYLGRFDEQKKVRGYRVEVEEIENVLSTFSGVRQCAVAVDEDRYGHPRIVAYVVSLEQKAFDSHGLRSWLQQKLPDFMLPALFVALEQLPLTPSGKINRSALPRPGAEWHSQAAVVIPRDATEQVLVKIWEHVLDRRPIGVNEDFFELGGHSFLAIRLMAEIKSITGKDIPVSALFQGATVEHLASVIKNGGGRFSYPLIMELRDKPQATEYSEAPFFCVAAPGVNAIGYLSLRRHMNRRRPLYKLQAPRPGGTAGGEGGRFYTAKEWETLAQEYCLALRFVQPHGPYYLGGMCGGAIAAYEVARLLESQGETVGLVAVFDTWVHEGTEVPFLVSIHWYSMRARQILRLPPEERWVQLWQLFRRRYDRLTHPQRRRDGASTTSSISAVLKSNGALYGGTVTVFRRRRQPYFRIRDRQLGWGMRTTGKVEVLEIATPIHEVVLREPFVKELAQRLDEKLCAVNTIYHGGLGR